MPDSTSTDSDASPVLYPRAFRSPVAWITLACVLALGLTLDLSLKSWSFKSVASSPITLDRELLLEHPELNPILPHPGVPILPFDLLDLQLVINRGAVFGIGANQRFFFVVFTLGALIAGLFVFARLTHAKQRIAHIAIGLILAGGLGNLFDRIVFGVVRDFLHMLPGYNLPFGWNWPGGSPEVFPWVFNCADVMLLTGMGLLMLHLNQFDKGAKQKSEASDQASEDEPS